MSEKFTVVLVYKVDRLGRAFFPSILAHLVRFRFVIFQPCPLFFLSACSCQRWRRVSSVS